MALVNKLRQTLMLVDLKAQQKAVGVKSADVPLHQVITGDGAIEQAAEYARELVARGLLKNTPVPLDCQQPMSDFMVQQAFKDAKGGMLIVMNLEHLARHETFVSLAERALMEGKCLLVLTGTMKAMQTLFADEPALKGRLPPAIDMDGPAVKAELAERAEQEKAAAIEAATVVQTPVQPMKPLTFKKDK
jgi:hypothetical protein